MVQILNINSSYPTVVLTSVKMDCSSITEAEFIDTTKKCLVEANKEYKYLVVPKCKEFITEQYMKGLEFSTKKAKTYAENKWKTEKRRTQYIESVKTNLKNKYDDELANLENISIDFFDFDGNCGTISGIDSNCIIRNGVTDEQLKACFYALQITRYFKEAIGLEFKYDAYPRTYTHAFRPRIELVLPEEIKKIAAKERKNLENCISSFYTSNKYMSD